MQIKSSDLMICSSGSRSI